MIWNYRIGTSIIKNRWAGRDDQDDPVSRTFYLIKCFYLDESDEEPFNFSKVGVSESPDLETLRWELDEMRRAYDMPIIDMDNFPKPYI